MAAAQRPPGAVAWDRAEDFVDDDEASDRPLIVPSAIARARRAETQRKGKST